MAHLLKESGDFECTVVPDPDYATMRRAILDHFNALSPPDTGLLFYSGHGIKNAGELYLCPTDMVIAKPGDLGLSGEEIRRRIGIATGARTHIIMLDCCYAGAITKTDQGSSVDSEPPARELFDPGSGSGVVYFSATDPRSQAPAVTKGSEAASTSPYTSLLLEGLGGAAGGDDPYVTAQALDAFLKRAAQERRLTLKPTFSVNHLVDEDIRLTLNPRPGWGRLPAEVRSGLDAPDVLTRVGAYFSLSRLARNVSRPQVADVAKRVMQEGLDREPDGRVSEAIRGMLEGLTVAAEQPRLKEQLATAETDRDVLRAEVRRLQNAVSSAEAAQNETEAQLREASETAAQSNAKLKNAEEELVKVRSDRDTALRQIEPFRAVQKLLEAAQADCANLNQRLDRSQAEKQAALDQVASLLREVELNAESKAATEERLRATKQRLYEISADRDAAESALAQATSTIDRLTRELADASKQVAGALEAQNAAQERANQTDRKLRETADALDIAVGERNGLRRDIKRLKIEGDAATGKLRDLLAAAERALAETREKLNKARHVAMRRRVAVLVLSAAAGSLATSVLFAGYLIPERITPQITIAQNERDQAPRARDDALKTGDEAQKARDKAIEERNIGIKTRDAALERQLPDTSLSVTQLKVLPSIAIPQLKPFDPNSDSNLPDVTPNGRRWSDEEVCKSYQTGRADDWRARWLGQRDKGTYIVWVYSDPAADENRIATIKSRFSRAFPYQSFERVQDSKNTWSIIVAGGLSNLTDAQNICQFARACIRSDSFASAKAPGALPFCQ